MLTHCSPSDISHRFHTVFTKDQIVAQHLYRMMRKNYLGKLLVSVPLGRRSTGKVAQPAPQAPKAEDMMKRLKRYFHFYKHEA